MKHLADFHANLKNVHEMVRALDWIYYSLKFLIGDLSEQGKHAYNLLINRCTSNSSSTHDEHSSSSSSSNREKSDYHSHYSSVSSLNSRSSSINKNEQQQQSITGQPLPPPPDLSSLGSKLTTATMANTFKLPASLTSNKYQTKSMNNDWS
jgi:hypothetical protein